MLDWFKGSLPARAGLAVILIATLAFCSAISAVLIAMVSEDDAAAINTAGSLRMATYRLNWRLEANADASTIASLRYDMHRRLDCNSLRHMIGDEPDDPVGHAFASIQRQWSEQLLPALERGDRVTFQQQSEIFVGQLENFVMQLQKQSEKRQSWQQSI